MYYMRVVFGVGMAWKLHSTPVYTHNDFRCLPFVAVGDDSEVHMCLPSGAEKLPGPFFHELGHLAHWYWFPEETWAVYSHYPDRLEVCAFLAVHIARHGFPADQIDGYFENYERGVHGLNAKQNCAIAGLIVRAYMDKTLKDAMRDVLTGQVDMGELERWV